MATKDEMLVDKRIIERNIQKGMLSQQDYAKYLDKLPDAAENAEFVSVEEAETSAESAEASDSPEGSGEESAA